MCVLAYASGLAYVRILEEYFTIFIRIYIRSAGG